jgi:hypothetical protein
MKTLTALLVLLSFNVNSVESNVMAFGARTFLNSDLPDIIDTDFWEIGVVGSLWDGNHSIRGGASTKLIEGNKLRFDYLFYQYDIPDTGHSIQVGQVSNALGFLNEGVFNPHARYTVLHSQVGYWTTVRGMGASALGVLWQYHSLGSPLTLQASIGEAQFNIKNELALDVIAREIPDNMEDQIEYDPQIFLSARYEHINHSVKYAMSHVSYENPVVDGKFIRQHTLGYRYETGETDLLLELFYIKSNVIKPSDYGLPEVLNWHGGNSHGFIAHFDWYASDRLSVYTALNMLYLNSNDKYGRRGKLQDIAELIGGGAVVPSDLVWTRTQTLGARYDITNNFRVQLEYQKTWGNYSNRQVFDFVNGDADSIQALGGESWDILGISFVFTTL